MGGTGGVKWWLSRSELHQVNYFSHSPFLDIWDQASQLARFLCGTEAMAYMVKILAIVSQVNSILAWPRAGIPLCPVVSMWLRPGG